jgi:hypothetical protein
LTDAGAVVWVDEASLAVLGRTSASTTTSLYVVPIAGAVHALPVIDGVTSVASGKGERSVLVGTSDGSVYALQGPSWRKVASGVRDPAFPG